MSTMASHIISLTIVYWTVYLGVDQRKQSGASPVFVRGIYRWPVNFPHKRPLTRKMFSFDDVVMVPGSLWACQAGLRYMHIYVFEVCQSTDLIDFLYVTCRGYMHHIIQTCCQANHKHSRNIIYVHSSSKVMFFFKHNKTDTCTLSIGLKKL